MPIYPPPPVSRPVMKFLGDENLTPGGLVCGPFWSNSADVALGACYWQAWICPAPGKDGYFIRDSVGGGHHFLAGTQDFSGKHRFVFFMHNDAAENPSLYSAPTDEIRDNEWTHVAWSVSSTGALRIWFNGILTAYTAAVGNRVTVASAPGLWIGGWSHQGWGGKIACVQAWDTDCDAFGKANTLASTGLRPSFFLDPSRSNQAGAIVYPDGSWDLTKPQSGVVDQGIKQATLGAGAFTRVLIQHHARPDNESASEPSRYDVADLPTWVEDPTCPFGTDNPHPASGFAYKGPRVSAPTDKTYLVWDSFGQRRSSPIEHNLPTLGNTESGTLGPLAWQYVAPTISNQFQWGVCWGYGINMTSAINVQNYGCFVDVGTSNHGVQSSMVAGDLQAALSDGPGVIFRRTDELNCFTAYVVGNTVTVRRYIAGVTNDHSYTMVTGYTSLRVTVTSGNLITVYSGSGTPSATTWTSVGSFTDATHSTATKVGMCNHQPNSVRRNSFGAFATS